MATDPPDPADSPDSPFRRALQSVVLHIQALSAGKAKLFDLLIAGQGDEQEINEEILDIDHRIALKQKEIALLKLQAMVTTGPSSEQIEALRAAVATLERMNAIAAGISGIVKAALEIADAALYKPAPAAAARVAAAGTTYRSPLAQRETADTTPEREARLISSSDLELSFVVGISMLVGAGLAAFLLRQSDTR